MCFGSLHLHGWCKLPLQPPCPLSGCLHQFAPSNALRLQLVSTGCHSSTPGPGSKLMGRHLPWVEHQTTRRRWSLGHMWAQCRLLNTLFTSQVSKCEGGGSTSGQMAASLAITLAASLIQCPDGTLRPGRTMDGSMSREE